MSRQCHCAVARPHPHMMPIQFHIAVEIPHPHVMPRQCHHTMSRAFCSAGILEKVKIKIMSINLRPYHYNKSTILFKSKHRYLNPIFKRPNIQESHPLKIELISYWIIVLGTVRSPILKSRTTDLHSKLLNFAREQYHYLQGSEQPWSSQI